MVSETIGQALGKRIAEAMEKKRNFDLWWAFTAHSHHSCASCGRFYLAPGWLRRHYEKTGHWSAPVAVLPRRW